MLFHQKRLPLLIPITIMVHTGVSHHLGDAFQTDAFRYEHRAEGVMGHVHREVFSPADGKAHFVDVSLGIVEDGKRKDRLLVVGGVVHAEYLLCYGMQGDEDSTLVFWRLMRM